MGGPWQTVVVGVAPQPAVPSPGERAARHLPGLLDPCRHPSARRLELLARGASRDARPAWAVWPPGHLESQQRAAPPHARLAPAAAEAVRFVGGDGAVALLQPVGSHPLKPFRLLLLPAGPAPSIGIAPPQGRAATVGLHHRVAPHLPGVVPIHLREDGGEAPPLGRARLWMPAVAGGRQHTRLKPLPQQAQPGAVLKALAQPGQALRVVQLGEAACDIGFHPIPHPARMGERPGRARTASNAPRPGREPYREASKSCSERGPQPLRAGPLHQCHVLPRVAGFPRRRVLGMLRPPRSLQRVLGSACLACVDHRSAQGPALVRVRVSPAVPQELSTIFWGGHTLGSGHL